MNASASQIVSVIALRSCLGSPQNRSSYRVEDTALKHKRRWEYPGRCLDLLSLPLVIGKIPTSLRTVADATITPYVRFLSGPKAPERSHHDLQTLGATLKKQPVLLLILLSLATVFTAACGDSSSSVPQFTALTFISNRTVTPPTTLFWSKLDGSAVTAVPLSSNNVYYPSISADGTVVAFYSSSDAWVQKTDGTGALNLTTNTASHSEINFVRISPNG